MPSTIRSKAMGARLMERSSAAEGKPACKAGFPHCHYLISIIFLVSTKLPACSR